MVVGGGLENRSRRAKQYPREEGVDHSWIRAGWVKPGVKANPARRLEDLGGRADISHGGHERSDHKGGLVK